MGRNFPANRNFCGESQATDRDAAWNGVTVQQEIEAGVVLQYNHEAEGEKGMTPRKETRRQCGRYDERPSWLFLPKAIKTPSTKL